MQISKYACSGCSLCATLCPAHCITMKEDEKGFLYPEVNTAKCINCGMCIKSCPENQEYQVNDYTCHAMATADMQLRQASSSGGIFGALAELFLKGNGAVVGAAFTESMNVELRIIQKMDELPCLQGSKYVQAAVPNGLYKRVQELLEAGTSVLFSGTPCQIAAMNAFLSHKQHANLLLVEVICHGVPAPAVWRAYLDYVCEKQNIARGDIAKIHFRDKRTGWSKSSFVIETRQFNTVISQTERQNGYMQLFGRNVILRPSCAVCQFKEGRSGADITLGDFWGLRNIGPELFDDAGISIVIVHSPKAREPLNKLNLAVNQQFPPKIMLNANPPFRTSTPLNRANATYFSMFAENDFRWFPPEDFISIYAKNSIRAKFKRAILCLKAVFYRKKR